MTTDTPDPDADTTEDTTEVTSPPEQPPPPMPGMVWDGAHWVLDSVLPLWSRYGP